MTFESFFPQNTLKGFRKYNKNIANIDTFLRNTLWRLRDKVHKFS